ncbi:MAG: rRNA maturation RNase YbeY [bacterium]|nr:rRNA maturation RNase YbeY [bacterium]
MQELVIRKEQSSWRIPSDRQWSALLSQARRHILFPKHVVVTVGIVGDATMKRLNGMYRGKRKTTDVLSFNYTPITKQGVVTGQAPQPKQGVGTGRAKTKIQTNRLEGDIIICFPQARRQARAIGNTISEELFFLFVHGLLHLFGYDHEKSRAEERRMFALQDLILGRKK